MRILYPLALVLAWLFLAGSAHSQKVGLVLSGGGAKGVAHIGVIRALEEAKIPIDYITGTSMGAIIGALYASGYSPDQMETIFRSDDFKSWISGKVDDRYRYLFKKPVPDASWVDFRFKIDSLISPTLPSNLVSPLLMDFAFLEIYSGAAAASGYNFDSLMVPYRCIASDIADGEAIVLSNGDLASAVRASMTFPFYFRPIRINGKMLFDGGMYNNFPSDVMYDDFFPDIIIGSLVAGNFTDPKDDNIVSQLENMLMVKQNYSVLCDNSVMIRPHIPSVNVIDFSNTIAFIDSGYVAARRTIQEIRSFVVDEVSPDSVAAKRRAFNEKKPPLIVGDLKVSGLKTSQVEYVSHVLGLGKPPAHMYIGEEEAEIKPRTLDYIKPAYFKLMAEDKIEHVYPRMAYDRERGFYKLFLDVQKETHLIAGVGGAVTSSAVNELSLHVLYNYWTRLSYQAKANAYFGRFYNSAMIDGRVDFVYPRPYFLKARFTYNKFNYFKTNTYFFEDEDPFFLVERERFLTLMAGWPFTGSGVATIDVTTGVNRDDYFQTNNYTRNDTLDRTSFRYFSPGINLEYNSLNRKEYASSGAKLNVEARFVTGRESFIPGSTAPAGSGARNSHSWLMGRVNYENYYARIKRINLGFCVQAYYSTQDYFSNYTSSILAARPFQPFPEALTRFMPHYRANKFISGGTKNVYEIRRNLDFRLEGYVFVPFRSIKQNYITRKAVRADKIYVYPMATAAMIYHSPIGPISFNFNYYYGEDQQLTFFLKFGYLIFNKRPY